MYASFLHCVQALHHRIRRVSQHLVQSIVHQAAFPQSCDMAGLLLSMQDAKAFIQLCMQTCAHMHPHPTLRITAVVTASCQDSRRAKRKFTTILLVIMKFCCGTRELVIEVAHPSMCRRGVSVIAFVGERWVVIASRLDVRVRLRPIDSRRRLRPSSKLDNISKVFRWCCSMAHRSTS